MYQEVLVDSSPSKIQQSQSNHLLWCDVSSQRQSNVFDTFVDCSPQVGSQAKLSCENDTLTVTWSTDVTFDGTVTEIPIDLKQSLTDRIADESRYPILNMLVITRMPP
jgi:hypothetical protein